MERQLNTTANQRHSSGDDVSVRRAPKTTFMKGERVRKRGSMPLKKPPRTRQVATEATMLFCCSSITLIT